MLNRSTNHAPGVGGDDESLSTALSVDEIVLIVRRQWIVVVGFVAAALAIAVVYLLLATPRYTSTAEIVISGPEDNLIPQIAGVTEDIQVKDEDILTYIELIQSNRIIAQALASIGEDTTARRGTRSREDFDLFDRLFGAAADDTALAAGPATPAAADGARPSGAVAPRRAEGGDLRWTDAADARLADGAGAGPATGGALRSAVDAVPGRPAAAGAGERARATVVDTDALTAVKTMLSARRIGRTNVISVSYEDTDPRRAQAVVGAIAAAFVEVHAQKKVASAESAGNWLQSRIDNLRAKVLAADEAVQKFRTENRLLETNGQLVSDQALSNVNAQMLEAEAATAQARARYERVREIIKSGDTNAVIVDALDSSLITTLRAEYLNASKRQAEISAQLGPDHLQARKLRDEMSEYSRLIFEELGRIEDSYRNELAVAESREAKLRSAMDQASTVTSQSNQVMVQLRELERESQVYRSIYESMLSRLQEVNQRAALPVVVAELVNEPRLPDAPSFPQKPLVLGLAFLLGGALGAAAGALRELRDVSYKNGEDLKRDLSLRFLGYAPLVGADDGTGAGSGSGGEPVPGTVFYADHTARYAVDHSLSQFAETIRACRLATERREEGSEETPQRARIVGVVSSLPGEGKTTISLNYAASLAAAGHRTLVVDADLRRPGLTQLAARHASAGLFEVLSGSAEFGSAVLTDPANAKLSLLPAFAARTDPGDRALDHRKMGPFLELVGRYFDYVVVDLPPLAPVIDARIVAPAVDTFVFVVEWGVTARNVVQSIVEAEREVFDKCAGVVLNKTSLDRMKYYAYYGSVDYYRQSFGSYYVKK